MKRVLGVAIVAVIVLLSLVACGTPRTSPGLRVSLEAENQPTQGVQTIQGATNWFWNGGGYMSDSPHPLQRRPDDFAAVTLHLNGADGEIELRFSGNYSPSSVSAVRWRAEYATGTQPSDEVFDSWESVEVDGKTIRVSYDGEDYIYEVTASWPGTNSFASYTFRVISASE